MNKNRTINFSNIIIKEELLALEAHTHNNLM